MRHMLSVTAAAILLASFVPHTASDAANLVQPDAVESGRTLAVFLCSTCHNTDPNQKSPAALINPAPSFAAIANDASSTPVSLRKFLDTTHGDVSKQPMQMPQLMLTDGQKDAAVAYIMSLRSAQ